MVGYSAVKQLSEKNWYINDLSKRMVSISYNHKMKQFVESISQVDSILMIEEFAEKLENLPQSCHGTSYTYKRAFSENTLYGYADSILKYAGLSSDDIFYMPLLEHGIAYEDYIDSRRYNANTAYIFQGRYREKMWGEYSRKKAYYIGPYIHYCRSSYEKEELLQLKKQFGNTLLLFLPHSTEYEKVGFDVELLLDRYYKKSHESFQTVLVCFFWADVNKKIIRAMERQGIRLVSAGFKLDPHFVNRLKSIFMLADTVLYTSFSTSIGYAYYLNKNIVFDTSLALETEDPLLSAKAPIHSEFSTCFSADCIEKEEERRQLIDKYWGLSEVKSPEEIRKIYNENKRNIRKRIGF